MLLLTADAGASVIDGWRMAREPIASRNQAEFAVRASSEKPVERMAAGSTRSE